MASFQQPQQPQMAAPAHGHAAMGQPVHGQATIMVGQPVQPAQGQAGMPVYMGQPVNQPTVGRPYQPGDPALPPPYGQQAVIVQDPRHAGGGLWFLQRNTQPQFSQDEVNRFDDLQHIYNMGRSTKCFTIIDLFLIVLYALQYYVLLLLLPLPLIGFWGARNFARNLVMTYAVFLVIFAIGGRVVLIYLREDLLSRIFLVIVIVIELWILKIVIRFINALKEISEEDRALLRVGPSTHARFVYW